MDTKSSSEKEYYENDTIWSTAPSDIDLRRINTVSSSIPEDVKTILDIGCGNGILVNYLSDKFDHFERVHGFDRSESALKYVKTEKSIGNIDNLPFEDNEFDLITCLEVLEHLPVMVYQKALREI